MTKHVFPKKVLAEINKICVPVDKISKIDNIFNREPRGSGFVYDSSGGLSVHEFIKFEIMKLGKRMGYFPIPEFYLSEPPSVSGRIDMVWVDVKKGKPPRVLFAFEIERLGSTGGYPRSYERTLSKLKHLKKLVKYRALLAYSQDGGLGSSFLTPTVVRGFMKNGITVIANWPTLAEMWLEECTQVEFGIDGLIKMKQKGAKKLKTSMNKLTYELYKKDLDDKCFMNSLDSRLNQIKKLIKIGIKKDKNKRFRLVTEDYLKIANQIVEFSPRTPISKIKDTADQIVKRESTNPLIL